MPKEYIIGISLQI